MQKGFILSQTASVESPSIINPEPHPSGYGLCFLISALAPYYFIHWYVNEFLWYVFTSGDGSENAYGDQEVSPAL